MDADAAFLLVRWLSCGIWAGAGLYKLFHFVGFTEKMRGFGFPLPSWAAGAVILVELAGCIVLIAGVAVWAVALIWIGFTVWATWLEHRHVFQADGTIVFPELVQVCKNLSIIGGLVALILLDETRPDWLFHG